MIKKLGATNIKINMYFLLIFLKSKLKPLSKYSIGIKTKNIYLSIRIGSKIKV